MNKARQQSKSHKIIMIIEGTPKCDGRKGVRKERGDVWTD